MRERRGRGGGRVAEGEGADSPVVLWRSWQFQLKAEAGTGARERKEWEKLFDRSGLLCIHTTQRAVCPPCWLLGCG